MLRVRHLNVPVASSWCVEEEEEDREEEGGESRGERKNEK